MSVSREELTEIVDRSLGLHFEVDGKFEWVDRTTRTQLADACSEALEVADVVGL